MKLGFMTFVLPGYTMEEVLRFAARAGYDGVELRVDAGHNHNISSQSTAAERAAARRLFADHGIEVACIATSQTFNPDEPEKRREQIDLAKANLDLAADLGAKVVRIFAGAPGPLNDEYADRVAAGFDEVGEYAKESGVCPMLECGHDIIVGGAEAEAVFQRINTSNFGALWNYSEIDDETLRIMQPRLRHFHVHDEVMVPGNENILHLARRLAPIGYDGYFSLEIIKFANLPEADLMETAARVQKQIAEACKG